jgi:hypothetical protein
MYVTTFGPVCWVSSRTRIGIETLPWIYRPILTLMKKDDSPAARILLHWSNNERPATLYLYPSGVMSRYASWFAAENWQWRFRQVVEDRSTDVVLYSEVRWEFRNAAQR